MVCGDIADYCIWNMKIIWMFCVHIVDEIAEPTGLNSSLVKMLGPDLALMLVSHDCVTLMLQFDFALHAAVKRVVNSMKTAVHWCGKRAVLPDLCPVERRQWLRNS